MDVGILVSTMDYPTFRKIQDKVDASVFICYHHRIDGCDTMVTVIDSVVRKLIGAPPIPRDYATMEDFIAARKQWVAKANDIRHHHFTDLIQLLSLRTSDYSLQPDHWDILQLVIKRFDA